MTIQPLASRIPQTFTSPLQSSVSIAVEAEEQNYSPELRSLESAWKSAIKDLDSDFLILGQEAYEGVRQEGIAPRTSGDPITSKQFESLEDRIRSQEVELQACLKDISDCGKLKNWPGVIKAAETAISRFLIEGNLKAELYLKISIAFGKLSRLEQSLEAVDKGIEAHGSDGDTNARLYLQKAIVFNYISEWNQVISAAKLGVCESASCPGILAELYLHHACALGYLSQWNNAIGVVESAMTVLNLTQKEGDRAGILSLNLGPRERNLASRLYLQYAIALNSIGLWKKAESFSQLGIYVGGNELDIIGGLRLQHAFALNQGRQWARALESSVFKDIERLTDPDIRASLYLQSAVALTRTRHWRDAEEFAELGVKEESSLKNVNTRLFFHWAVALMKQNLWGKAVLVIERGLNTANKDRKIFSQLYLYQAVALNHQKEFTKVIEVTDVALRALEEVKFLKNQIEARFYLERAKAFNEQGRASLARQSADKGMELTLHNKSLNMKLYSQKALALSKELSLARSQKPELSESVFSRSRTGSSKSLQQDGAPFASILSLKKASDSSL